MAKRKANDNPAFYAGWKKCSLKFKPEWLRITVEKKLPTSSRKQATKLGDIFSYRERKDAVVVVVLVTRPRPRDGGIAEDHGAPEAGQLPRAWTRGRRETETRQRASSKSP